MKKEVVVEQRGGVNIGGNYYKRYLSMSGTKEEEESLDFEEQQFLKNEVDNV